MFLHQKWHVEIVETLQIGKLSCPAWWLAFNKMISFQVIGSKKLERRNNKSNFLKKVSEAASQSKEQFSSKGVSTQETMGIPDLSFHAVSLTVSVSYSFILLSLLGNTWQENIQLLLWFKSIWFNRWLFCYSHLKNHCNYNSAIVKCSLHSQLFTVLVQLLTFLTPLVVSVLW